MRDHIGRRLGWALVSLAVLVPAFTLVPALGRVGSSTAGAAMLVDGREIGFSPGAPFLWQSDAGLAADLDLVENLGGTWIRVDFDWPSIQPSGAGSFNWSNTDRIVNAARSRGLEVLALPTYTPSWARAGGTTDKYPPTNPDNFANFVSAAVQRYAPQGVRTWEIWNEPNLSYFWAPKPDASAYTTLLEKAYTAVKAADPSATVLSGGLSPAVDAGNGSQISPKTFLTRVYSYGGKGYFDAVGHHPYSFPYAPMTVGDWNTFYKTPDLYALMQSQGDGAKKIWATEIGFPTGTSGEAVSESVQADYLVQAIIQWTSWSFHGPFFVYNIRDTGTNPADREQNFGVVKYNRTQKPSYSRLTQLLRAPQEVAAVAGVGNATVSWSAPAYDYGSGITSYTVKGSGGESVSVSGSARSAVVTIPSGVSRTFTVQPVHGTTSGVTSAASNAVMAAAPGTEPKVVPGASSVVEGEQGTRAASTPVSLSAASTVPVTVSYTTYWLYPTGIAQPEVDFAPVTGSVTFNPGETSKNVTVTVAGDRRVEPDEAVVLVFSDPTNAKMGGFYGLGWVMILDED